MEEEISIEYEGKTYHGRKIVTGKRKLFQTVYYGTKYKEDGHLYKPHEDALMRSIAKTILRELVQESGNNK